MIAFAYCECGLTIERFFDLSFYEWSLEVRKAKLRVDRDKNIWEGDALLHREGWALMYNMWRGKDSPQREPKEFLKLSFDKIENKEIQSDEQLLSQFPKKLKDG